MLARWAQSNQVDIDFSRRGKPTNNAIVEFSNGRFHEESLITHWSDLVDDAKAKNLSL
jgi:putative transposase